MLTKMNLLAVSVLLFVVPAIEGLCYSPMIRGLAPDVILPSVYSSDILCPAPNVFDHYLCVCVDPSMVSAKAPPERRGALDLLHLGASQRMSGSSPLRMRHFVGLPDMHLPRRQLHRWKTSNRYSLSGPGSDVLPRNDGRAIVPELNPYGSFNMPANSNVLKAAAAKAKLVEASLPSKERELLAKARWQEELQRRSAVAAAAVAAAELAASSPTAAGPGAGGTALDAFVMDTLRRFLYGY